MSASTPPPVRSARRSASLRGRLLRATLLVAVAFVAICALTTIALRRLGGAIGLILRENYASVVACQEMNEALEREDSAALFAAVGHDDIARPMLVEQRARFDRAFDKEAANITLPGEGDLVREVGARSHDYVAHVDEVLAGASAQRVDRYFGELLPRFRVLKEKITAIRDMNQRNMEWADGEARRIARRTLEIAVVVTAFALLLVGALALRIPRVVLQPLAAFTARAKAIGEGKLDTKLDAPEATELRALAEALDRMQEKLRAYRESSLGELLAAKDLSRATIAAMVDPVIVFGAAGEVLLTNEAAESIFQVTPGDADELRRAGVEVPEPIAVARDAVLAHAEAIHPQSLAEAMRWITPEGERYFLVRAAPLKNEEAGGAAAIVVAQDVTRFRRIDALKSDVVATVSHELKTPLTSLRLATHMLLEPANGALTDVQRELAQTALDETERLQATVTELLDLVRIEREAGALEIAPVDAAALVREVVTSHQKLATPRNVRIAIDVEPQTTAQLDAEQIVIVLGNLLSNAIRHSPDGSTVWMRAKNGADETLFEVRDEGEGIAAEDLPHVFERHWSGADPARLKGRHGLGLAIAKEIAVRHGGTIEAESVLGKGSTFRLKVPRREAGAAA